MNKDQLVRAILDAAEDVYENVPTEMGDLDVYLHMLLKFLARHVEEIPDEG